MTRALSVSEVADLTGLSQKELEERVVQRSLRVLRTDGEWMISLDSLARAGLSASGGEDGDIDGVLARLERLAISLGEQRQRAVEARGREAAERSARSAAEAELREERVHRRQMEVEREAALELARAAEAARLMAQAGRDDGRIGRASATKEDAAPSEPRTRFSLPRPAMKRPAMKRPALPRPSIGRPGLVADVGGRAARSLRSMARPGVREVPLLGPIRIIPAIAAAGAACLILVGLSAAGMPAGGIVVLGGALAALVYLVGTGPRDTRR